MTSDVIFRWHTETPSETEQCGAALAAYLLEHEKNGAFCAMYGDLGAGKTAFVRGAATVIAPGAAVQSPTYTIVNEYKGKNGLLLHFDMYRIDSEDDLDSIDFWTYLDRASYAFAEWSEKIPYAIPACFYKIVIEKCGAEAEARHITVTKLES